MAAGEHCPRCGKGIVVHGSFPTRGARFRPEELRLFSLSFQIPEVSVSGSATACASCGLVWAELDAAKLRQKLHDLGNEDVRCRLGKFEDE